MYYVYKINRTNDALLMGDTDTQSVKRYSFDEALEFADCRSVKGISDGKIEPFNLEDYIKARVAKDKMFDIKSEYSYKEGTKDSLPTISLDACVLSKTTNYKVLDGTTAIGNNAFSGANGTWNEFQYAVDLPMSCQHISSSAFRGTGLCRINLDRVRVIESQAFMGCNSLTDINFKERRRGASRATSEALQIGQFAFALCNKLQSVNISQRVDIALGAFAGCASLNTVVLEGDTELSEMAFKGCTALTTIDTWNITQLATEAFYGCTSLKKIDMSGLKSIVTDGDNPAFFENCSSLEYLNWKRGLPFGHEGSLFGCNNLKRIDNVTKVVDDVEKCLPKKRIEFHFADTEMLKGYFKEYNKIGGGFIFNTEETANLLKDNPKNNIAVYEYV